ncbi:hypothetical protein HYZ41_01065 [archaeon]|nr:hypothetical protein [archaeon]
MKLREYLDSVKECSDKELGNEYGIYDNFSILLNANFETVINDLENFGNYKLYLAEGVTPPGKILNLNYLPGVVNLRILNWVMPGSGLCIEGIEEKNYNMTINLHSYQDRKIDNTSDSRAIAMVVGDVGEYILKNNITACFPKSRGDKHHKPADYTRIVFNP